MPLAYQECLKSAVPPEDPGAAVTRALGDADVKGDGVMPDPEVTETTLTPRDEYFVMACDGLWDVVSNEEAVSMIKVSGGEIMQPRSEKKATRGCVEV